MSMQTKDQGRKVNILRDAGKKPEELWLDVYVAGDRYEQQNFAEMFVRARCSGVQLPEDADVVVFTGGADVNPALYGEEVHDTTRFDIGRDTSDLELYDFCLKAGIPMFGVCRGAQFLHVMNGGRLYQDVDNHNGDHCMYDQIRKRMVDKVSSVHHQMCIKNDNMEVVGTSARASKRWRNPTEFTTGGAPDVEAFFYRDTCCFGVQGHPEYRGYSEFAHWTLARLNEYINENPDLELVNRVRRMKPDLVKQRQAIQLAQTVIIKENQ